MVVFMADEKFDAIIVLGGGITAKGNLSRVAKSRMDRAIELYRSGAAPRIIVTGKNEAQAIRRYAIRKSISPEDVMAESHALDTVGNAFFVRKNFLERNKWNNVIIVTSIFHVPRAKLVFRKVLGKPYVTRFAPSVRVLSDRMFNKKLQAEKGLLLLTRFLSALVADGDMQAIGNFLDKNPLYAAYNRS